MRSQLHWIDLPTTGRLAIMACPRAGDGLNDEISGWRAQGIDLVVSLLEPDEARELGLHGEADLCREHGMQFIAFPIPDRGVPTALPETMALARAIAKMVGEGMAVAVHCQAGIGRSSLIAACALACSGFDPDAAFDKIGKARGVDVPETAGQRDWVIAFHDAVTVGA